MTQSDLLPLDGVDDDTRRAPKSTLETDRTLTVRPIPEELSKEDRKRLCSVLVAKIREHIERS